MLFPLNIKSPVVDLGSIVKFPIPVDDAADINKLPVDVFNDCPFISIGLKLFISLSLPLKLNVSIKTPGTKKSILNIGDYIKSDEELLDKIKKMEIVSNNSDTESEIDEDNLFDIDSYDSELDNAPFDDGGGLSD